MVWCVGGVRAGNLGSWIHQIRAFRHRKMDQNERSARGHLRGDR